MIRLRDLPRAAALGLLLAALVAAGGQAQVPSRTVPSAPAPEPSPEPSPAPSPEPDRQPAQEGTGAPDRDTRSPSPRAGGGGEGDDRERAPPRPAGSGGDWIICNRSDEAQIHVVAAWQRGGRWQSTGWIALRRDACADVPDVDAPEVFYFATGSARAWPGRTPFCLSPRSGQALPGRACGSEQREIPFRRAKLGRSDVFTNFR
jgi:hypothetical protein